MVWEVGHRVWGVNRARADRRELEDNLLLAVCKDPIAHHDLV